mmetsp:Transcript_47046/g.102182  ORF Transcript_47046/g.102182 Transcript_47046/m.102182 type:complete len:258 (-) Transcript_47046:495-1268(-)
MKFGRAKRTARTAWRSACSTAATRRDVAVIAASAKPLPSTARCSTYKGIQSKTARPHTRVRNLVRRRLGSLLGAGAGLQDLGQGADDALEDGPREDEHRGGHDGGDGGGTLVRREQREFAEEVAALQTTRHLVLDARLGALDLSLADQVKLGALVALADDVALRRVLALAQGVGDRSLVRLRERVQQLDGVDEGEVDGVVLLRLAHHRRLERQHVQREGDELRLGRDRRRARRAVEQRQLSKRAATRRLHHGAHARD